jgi:glyoxylase-like metal-dependent hydrolase (beta-lactamase superfamily II)
MFNFSIRLLMIFLLPLQAYAYTPKAEQVVNNVYALVGPLDQRSEDNDGLNNNQGFIVTKQGVILVDSGASLLGAEKIARAIAEVTTQPVKWVINLGGQDHRWLGNDYFAQRGAEIIALRGTADTQRHYAEQQLEGLQRFLGKRLQGTKAHIADTRLADNPSRLERGGERLELHYTNAHFPGDAMLWLPEHKVIFTGDLVYVDRLVAMLPWSSVRNAQQAFRAMEKLAPKHIVPGHGQVCDLATARRDSGDYYDFLNNVIGAAASDMEPMSDVLNQYTRLPAFEHLEHFDDLHRANMNRTYLEYEAL